MLVVGTTAKIITILFVSLLKGQVLDSRYHTLPEIYNLLDSLDQMAVYDDLFHLETIGFSARENLPIKAVKISDNASTKEDEARVLFLGQCHAEEVLGVEAVIELIYYLLDPPPADAYHVSILRQNLEIWIVPTHNPEGLNVVHAGLDVTYRKNKTDFSPTGPFPNGIFNYDPGIGDDIDGVDLNRNYDFNWVFGDTFLEPDLTHYGAHYDYYRGTAPWSEPEIVAIRDLALENDFLFSIAWHSSRSGAISEKVFTSWQWENTKYPPDIEEMITIGNQIASLIEKQSGVTTYESLYSTSRSGKAHDWFYTATGCFQYLIECGVNIQPDSSEVEDTIDRLMPAQIYLLDRAIGYNEDAGQITGVVRDGAGYPLEGVEVVIEEKNGGMLQPRKTDEFGRFRRIFNPGTYTFRFRKFGYIETTIQATANNSAVYEMDVLLTPATMHEISFVLNDLCSDVRLRYDNGIFSGEADPYQNFDIPEGEWYLSIHVMDEGYEIMPWAWTVNIASDREFFPEFPAAEVLHLNVVDSSWWSSVDGSWSFDENGLTTNKTLLYSNSNSVPAVWQLDSPWMDVSGSNKCVLEIRHQYELEWDHDSIQVILLDADGVLAQKTFKDQHWGSTINDIISVFDSTDFDSIMVRLIFGRDQTVAYRGWDVAEMKLFHAHVEALVVQAESDFNPIQLGSVSSAYPNPSTGSIAIYFENWRDPINITVYNLLGQEIYRETLAKINPQRHTWRFDLQNQYTTSLSSGIYFIRLSGNRKDIIRKCIFLKQ